MNSVRKQIQKENIPCNWVEGNFSIFSHLKKHLYGQIWSIAAQARHHTYTHMCDMIDE